MSQINKKNLIKLIVIAFFAFVITSCSNKARENNKLTFTHYASGGLEEKLDMDIIFEENCSTFTAYQVAYSSCTCRDSLANYKSICYVEILNTKDSGEDASIRYISFGENRGLFGDSNPNYYISKYDEEYYDKNLFKPLIGITKHEIDEFSGYGNCIDALNVDAITGATVTYSNLQSMLKTLFKYHKDRYYNGK